MPDTLKTVGKNYTYLIECSWAKKHIDATTVSTIVFVFAFHVHEYNSSILLLQQTQMHSVMLMEINMQKKPLTIKRHNISVIFSKSTN